MLSMKATKRKCLLLLYLLFTSYYQSECFINPSASVASLSRGIIKCERDLLMRFAYKEDGELKRRKGNSIYDGDGEEQGYNFWEEPTTIANFNMDLENLATEDAGRAQDALQIMEEMYSKQQQQNEETNRLKNENNSKMSNNETQISALYIKPNAACYTTVIDGWVMSDDPNAADNAQALLDKMERMYDETKDETLRPNAVTYMLVCQAWNNDRRHRDSGLSAERAELILRRMKDRKMQPNVKLYSTVIGAWCKVSDKVRGAMQRAEALLSEMEESDEIEDIVIAGVNENGDSPSYRTHHCETTRPNVITYTTIISGHTRSKDGNLATKAQAILERMEQNNVQPDMFAFTSVLNAWSKAKSYNEHKVAAKEALAIIKKMEELCINEGQYHVKPNAITYSTCINAIGNSLEPSAPEMAERVLRHMYDVSDRGLIEGIKPQTIVFNAVINCLARSTQSGNRRKNAQKAESLLVEMSKRSKEGEVDVEPNVKTWAGVMLAWAQTDSSAVDAQRVLDNLEKLYEIGETSIRPNVVCYTTVMKAWSSSGRRDAVDRAEQILLRMEERFIAGDNDVRPNAITYVTMINSFVRNQEHPRRAQETVDRMMRLYLEHGGCKPNRIVFNALINAWSRSNRKGSAEQAEKILQWMERLYQAGDNLKPDVITFCGVLNAWATHARDGGARRAQQILDHFEELTIQERGFQRSVVCYNIVIKAWARSGEPDAIYKAEEILKRLEKQSCRSSNEDDELRPDIATYSSVINCCAYYSGPVSGRKEAFQVAMRTFNKLCSSSDIQPNHVTYGTLFKAINKLVPMDKLRDDLITSMFRKCCEAGQVDSFVLSQVRNSCGARKFRELMGMSPSPSSRSSTRTKNSNNNEDKFNNLLLKKIPKEWTQNVIESREYFSAKNQLYS